MSDHLIASEPRFVAAPHALLECEGFRIGWPYGGYPAALDAAAATLLDCFSDPLSPAELAEDLIIAIGLDSDEAHRSVGLFAAGMVATGHLLPEGLSPMPTSLLSYPPAASP